MNNLNVIYRRCRRLLPDFPPCMKKHLISSGIKQRNKLSRLSVSEVMTIVIAYQQTWVTSDGARRTFVASHFYLMTQLISACITKLCEALVTSPRARSLKYTPRTG
ncbi:hypothetical protein [Candidatus Enterovibrio escicola]|uniref:Mobile element protein n=1 Tax=Candidatus Enterovibrio escicola TaxID=1927127 RepID=A0A2A5T7H5_9GAMM|nr:hypothetical protein [Candidatus Enterovibrio escacola]PCS24111.1 Mobile element protein [Candidatus Enterovibrio escacola]